jgi:hypothetical protein
MRNNEDNRQECIISLDHKGRFLLPVNYRENLAKNQKFLLTRATDGTFTLTPISQVVEAGLGLYQSNTSFVEALFADRQKEFEQE